MIDVQCKPSDCAASFTTTLLVMVCAMLFSSPLPALPNTTQEADQDTDQGEARREKPFAGSVCSIGGCSIGHHSIPALAPSTFRTLLEQFNDQPISARSDAFERLLFYGRQTRAYINQTGTPKLGQRRTTVLKNELSRTHALVSLRITDQRGNNRVRLQNKRVPLGESKHFRMRDTTNLKPPELSGTVYRVGVRHLWARY